MKVEIQKQHQWLRKFEGQWSFESACPSGPDGKPSRSIGAETVRMLGEAWIVGEGHASMPDGNEGQWITTVGYDPRVGRFVGSWMGSMMTNMFVYSGFLDDAQRVLTLETEGPDFFGDPSKTVRYRDITEFVSDDHRVMTSRSLQADGSWKQFNEAHYHRVGVS